MAALAARTAARRSIFVDGRDVSVASTDSNAARFLEVEVVGEAGTADADVSMVEVEEGAGTDPDEDNGGMSTTGRGVTGVEDGGDDGFCDSGGAGEDGGTDE